MGYATAAMIALTAANTASQMGAASAQNEFSKRMTEINIRRAKRQQADALDRGADKANKYRQKVQGLVGSQIVNLAAQGISLTDGNAPDIVSETFNMGYEDARNIELNAFRESMGYGMQATDYQSNQIMDNVATQTRVQGTLLNGIVRGTEMAMDEWGDKSSSTNKK
jgi:hypothetical protein